MTDRELMQQALDALEYVIQSVGGNAPESFDVWFQKTQVPAEALRARLAQPEPEPVAWTYQHEDTGLTMCVLTQQVEPGFEKNNPRWQKSTPLYTAPPHFLDPAKVARLMDEAFERGKKEIDMEQVKDIAQKLADCALLNSAPPQREWQGLTDEEVIKLGRLDKDSDYFGLWYDFAQAIEAKLKDKNGY